MNKPYTALSKVYEYLICDCDYQKWSQYILDRLNYFGVSKLGIDCACGSGYFTRTLKKGGYDVTGIDLCEEMLIEAERQTAKEGLSIQYLKMDMLNLRFFKKVGFITVINDAVNYISQDKLLKLFKTFSRAIEHGGILAFDFSSEYKIKNVIAENLFGEDDESCSYLWFNKQGDGYVDMDISLFTRQGDLYIKRDESHRQYIHKLDNVLNQLRLTDFDNIEVFGHLGEKLSDESLRVQIFARRK